MQGLLESEVWVVGRSDLTQRLRAKAQGGGNKAREVWGPPWMGGGQCGARAHPWQGM